MSKKKWQVQADDYLRRILEVLKFYEGVSNIDQYKDMLFGVFKDAYQSGFCNLGTRCDEESGKVVYCESQRPLVLGDTIWSYAKAQEWVHAEMSGKEKRYKDIELVRIWWDAWIYAWNHPRPKRKYERKPSSKS